jgi:two-component system sensor histidine kinase EvgS
MNRIWPNLIAALLAVFALPGPGHAAVTGDSWLTKEEKAWIAAHPTVRVALSASLPVEYFDDGVARGLSVDYTRLIAERTGLKFVYVRTDGKSKPDMLRNAEADLCFVISHKEFASTSLGISSVPTKTVHPLLIVSRQGQSLIGDPRQLEGKTVAILNGWQFEDELKAAVPGIALIKGVDASDVLAKLLAKEADFAIGTELLFLPYLHRRWEGQLQLAGIYGTRLGRMAALTREDDVALQSILQKIFSSLTTEETHDLYRDWLDRSAPEVPSHEALGRHFAFELALAGLLVLLASLLIVQLYRQRTAAVRNERDKARFMAIVSHEIRSPMNAVLAAVELLRNTKLDEQQQHFARLADNGGLTLLRLVDDVLDISKVEAGQLKLEREPADLAELARNVVELHRLRAHEKNITLHLALQPLPPWLMLDSARVAQVLHNLISNAIKFTEIGGVEVAVAASAASPGWLDLCIDVRDTGIGISAETQTRLFQPYMQAAATYKRSGGTGLGLVICRELATLMDGTISLTSDLGKGTTVRFLFKAEEVMPGDPRIPVEAAPALAERTAQAQREDAAGGRLNFLVVEDTPANQEVLRAQIDSLGFDAEVVGDGAQAEAAFGRCAFDLVLMDCDLPDTDGYTLAMVFREMEDELGRKRTPIVAISASNDERHVSRCFESGMDGVLSKPIRMGKLQDIIELWCGMRTEPREPIAVAPAGLSRTHLREDLRVLRESLAAHDTDSALRAAHRLHGAALVLGLARIAQAAGHVEALLRAGADGEVDASFASLQACWDSEEETVSEKD